MSIELKVYQNSDHTCLAWITSDGKPVANCRGFAIRRILNTKEGFLHGFVGFSDGDKLDPDAPWKMPLQRFMWWDYDIRPGDVVQYSVIPVTGSDKDHLTLATEQASALSVPLTSTGLASPQIGAYFNRGIVAAQWVARSMAGLGKNAKLADVIADVKSPLRQELSGILRTQILGMLADAKKNNGDVYAALYELNDPELIDALSALGKKCHLILANGAFKSNKAGENDENADLRAQLKKAGKIDLSDRIVPTGHFAHNKFIVVCDSAGKPRRVLSGSTNWTKTGLCTQANNGIIVDSPDLAQGFLNEWQLLKSAGNTYPKSLAQANSTPITTTVDGNKITQWFVPTNGAVDLEYARKLINGAKEGIMFLFFNPGVFASSTTPPLKWTLLQNIVARHQKDSANYDPDLYIRGVVNQTIKGLTSPDGDDAEDSPTPAHAHLAPETRSPVLLFNGAKKAPTPLSIESMVPKAIKEAFHNWRAESLGTGVHIHSKVIIVDPFGDHPVVMTGSHNLGFKASSMNDDNLMIVEGNGTLAAAYATNIIAIFNNYRWNTYVEAHLNDPQVWHGLQDSDSWQSGYLTGESLAELHFWMGSKLAPATPAAAVTAPPATAKKKPAARKPAAKK